MQTHSTAEAPKRRRRKSARASARLGELTKEEERLHKACMLANTSARQREAFRAANRAKLAKTFGAYCRRLAALVGAEQLPECGGYLVHHKRRGWLVATNGDHDHQFALVRSPTGQSRVVELGKCVEDYGQWRVWDQCTVVRIK